MPFADAQARGSSHTIARCQDVIMHSSHTGWSSPTGCHSVIMRRAQRSAAGHLLHTTQSSSGIGMTAACSPKVANLWLSSARLQPYLRKVNGAHRQTRSRSPASCSLSYQPSGLRDGLQPCAGAVVSGAPPTETGPTGLGCRATLLYAAPDSRVRARPFGMEDVICSESTLVISVDN